MKTTFLTALTAALVLAGCRSQQAQPTPKPDPSPAGEQAEAGAQDSPAAIEDDAPSTFELPYQKYTLANGLDVVLHRDSSDPVVALATFVHVGSNREQPGKTGFAHFFEHMSFNDSENVPRGSNRKLIGELGGTRNGGTTSDTTMYYEVVPKDAFEKLLWIDSDRLGYMINTVTEWALENEKQVVKNEKRQRVDNAAYGHTRVVIPSLLYPPDHPYHWPVIGSLEDLQAATLADVREFYDRYYGAANATLVIAGDIDIEATKTMVEQWFGEIRRGPDIAPLKPRPAKLERSVLVYHEDNFAKVPELTMVFPSVEQYHKDSYALDALGEILSTGKRAALYQVIVEGEQLAPSVAAYNDASEVAGSFRIKVRANAGVDLDAVKAGVERALARFEAEGVREQDLAQIKAKQETRFYASSENVLGKAFMLGNYNEFAGDPGYAKVEIARIQALEAADLTAVYERYIKAKPYVLTSFVPLGEKQLAVEGATPAQIVEEKIVQGAEQSVAEDPDFEYSTTPTKHDRSEPKLGELPVPTFPTPWSERADNGLRSLGIQHTELPLVRARLRIEGGHSLDSAGKAGTASLLATLMLEGTRERTPEQLQDAFADLGANVNAWADDEALNIEVSGLARHYPALVELLSEIVLEPRWDEAEFTRLSAAALERIRQRAGRPSALAHDAFERIVYGEGHSQATPASGTLDSVGTLSLDDLRGFWTTKLSPSRASFIVVGDVSQDQVQRSLEPLATRWKSVEVAAPVEPVPPTLSEPKLYFIDVPGSKQSVLTVGRLSLAGTDPNYNALTYVNDALGAGSKSRLVQLLRIEKGYTYGARSSIPRRRGPSPFSATTSVRANVTLESLILLREQLEGYSASFTQADLDLTKGLLTKQSTRRFETLRDLLAVLDEIARLNLPLDNLAQAQRELDVLTLTQAHALIDTHLDPSQMVYVVVGDAKTQLPRVREFGLGEPVLLSP